MTDAEWLACDDPQEMLAYLDLKASERKLRLFAVGCCRRYWHELRDEIGRKAVEVAELHADRLASDDEMFRAARDAEDIVLTNQPDDDLKCASANAAGFDLFEEETPEDRATRQRLCALEAASSSSYGVAYFRGMTANINTRSGEYRATYQVERVDQARLLRCLFTPEPRKPIWFAAVWRTATVVSVTDAIYTERAFDRLPILADALEEAGCDNHDILHHCRQPGPHARGCWVVDLVLGKQ